ncbi:hypothetical protein ACFLR2_01350, partial [Chlamydiota bacterium]
AALRSEVIELKVRFEKIKAAVDRRNCEVSQKRPPEKSAEVFFKEQFAEVTLSKKVEFLLQCYLLAVTRAPLKRLENGIILTKSDASFLTKLSSRISVVSAETRRKIVECAQFNVSANSVEFVRSEAEKLTSFAAQEKERVSYMLSPEVTRVYTPDEKYEPKTFGCLFYEYKTILYRLREEKGLVCFKSIVPPNGTPFWILLQPSEPGAEFSIIPEEACKAIPAQSAMVVFEGVVNEGYDKTTFSEKISEIGFTELILATAAIEAPYERTSDLSYVKNKSAQAEIICYRAFAEEIECQKDAKNPLLILDHVYCNLLKAEVGRKI